METIIEPNSSFDFSKLSLAHPSGIQGGAYFTKIEYEKKPLYIQTCKSLTKQGIMKTGKKYHCDLMFDKNAETLINWFEHLEDQCKKLIYEKKELWFQNNLEENDIESAFNPLIRIYKSGKYYLIRTNIKNTRNDEAMIKIYDENEVALSILDITSETNIISILDIQGIKFTSRNFQIEIELKQCMVLNNEKIFDNCLIKKNPPLDPPLENLPLEKVEPHLVSSAFPLLENAPLENLPLEKGEPHLVSSAFPLLENASLENLPVEKGEPNLVSSSENNDSKTNSPLDPLSTLQKNEENMEKHSETLDLLELDIEDLDKEIEENNDEELKEIQMDLDLKELESIKLKKPNQVYFELYKEARNKAKIAKKNAILAYLEAKNIKKTYMLDNLNDSDSDFDAEIDEMSESELEGL
jgi:hypothetical protein